MSEWKLDERDYEDLERVVSLQATLEEVAVFFRKPISLIRNKAANDPRFREIFEGGRALSRLSLRRLQWRHANGRGPAAVAMTIHLSKHWLGEHDKSQIDVNATIKVDTNNAADKILHGIDPSLLTDQEQIELTMLCDEIDNIGLVKLRQDQQDRFWTLMKKAGGEEVMDVTPLDKVLALPAPPKDVEDVEFKEIDE